MQVELLGYPVAHSLSPALHNAAFAAVGLDWRYRAVEVLPQHLAPAVEALRSDDRAGANLTIPHKQAVVPLLDELRPSGVQTSAVNTIVNDRGRLVGHNTDMAGFLQDLRAHWQVPTGGRAVILGAGGAARAVAFGLAQHGLDLWLISRSAGRAAELAQSIHRSLSSKVEALPWTRRSFSQVKRHCDLVVNATPLGMRPQGDLTPWPDEVPLPPSAFVYDLVYAPGETKLVRRARQSGLPAAAGGGMLLEQAALSFELWTGLPAPRTRMQAALDAALERSPDRRAVPRA